MKTWLMLAGLLLVGCGGTKQLPIVTLTIGGVPLRVEVASSDEQRKTGLMNRDSMPEEHGMVFVYPDAKIRGFWMKNTRIPLSIAFVDSEGTIRRIADMKPYVLDRTSSLYPSRYAIETHKGWFERHGLESGAKVEGLEALKVPAEVEQ